MRYVSNSKIFDACSIALGTGDLDTYYAAAHDGSSSAEKNVEVSSPNSSITSYEVKIIK